MCVNNNSPSKLKFNNKAFSLNVELVSYSYVSDLIPVYYYGSGCYNGCGYATCTTCETCPNCDINIDIDIDVEAEEEEEVVEEEEPAEEEEFLPDLDTATEEGCTLEALTNRAQLEACR